MIFPHSINSGKPRKLEYPILNKLSNPIISHHTHVMFQVHGSWSVCPSNSTIRSIYFTTNYQNLTDRRQFLELMYTNPNQDPEVNTRKFQNHLVFRSTNTNS